MVQRTAMSIPHRRAVRADPIGLLRATSAPRTREQHRASTGLHELLPLDEVESPDFETVIGPAPQQERHPRTAPGGRFT